MQLGRGRDALDLVVVETEPPGHPRSKGGDVAGMRASSSSQASIARRSTRALWTRAETRPLFFSA